jgi:beta-barrel assembly-enhancing protease
MKHRAALAIIALVSIAALVASENRKVEAPVGPGAFLYFLADTQRELIRMPVSFIPLSDDEEIKIGDRQARFYGGVDRLSAHDPQSRALENYVQQVGARVAAHAHRKLPYRFHYIPDYDFVNAFAVPGGHVYVAAGLMSLMESEDALAAILGHEVEHIDHYHCAQRIQIQAALQKVPLGELVELPVEVFEAGYRKDQELEADREGTRLAVAASYSPRGALQIFETFDRLHHERESRAKSPQEELSQVALETLEGYFRSHPLPSERIAQIQGLFGRELQSGGSTRPLLFAYVFLNQRAERALAAKHYDEAVKLATHSLELEPSEPRAWVVLAEAKFALGDFTAAASAYRTVLERSATTEEAEAVKVFADGLAEEALKGRHYADAARFATHSLELQPNHREGLTTLAEAQLALGDLAGAAKASDLLKRLYPQSVEDVVGYAGDLVDWALQQGQYEQAAGLATFALALRPDQPDVLRKLADVQFEVADFSAAAGSYRKLIGLSHEGEDLALPGLIRSYADALGAVGSSHAAESVRDFEAFMTTIKPPDAAFAAQLRIELAGLKLMAGDESEAKAVIAGASQPGSTSVAPESLSRLGWWYYRAEKYRTSVDVLSVVVRQRSGDLEAHNDLAWDEFELGGFEIAQQRFAAAEPGSLSPLANLPAMGRALAHWKIEPAGEDLDAFDLVTKNNPQWLNPKWVQSIYSPSVVRSVGELQAASVKRKTGRKNSRR